MKYGGIYLDLDVWVLRPFSALLTHDFVMGQEGVDGNWGLCNAVIVAAKDSEFLRIWYDAHRTFNDTIYNYYGVQLPGILAKQHPSLIKVMGHTTFFWPLWYARGLDAMFSDHTYDYASNLAVHPWNSAVRRNKRLDDFSQSWLLQCRSPLLAMMRIHLPQPLFSIIMPCQSRRQHIREAVESVIRQSWPNWELIVVDDGSLDNCGRYVEELAIEYRDIPQMQNALTVIRQQNRGLAQARNAGIRKARGMWISALDADDIFGHEYFLKAEQAMSKNPALEMIFSDQHHSKETRWHWNVSDVDNQSSLITTRSPLTIDRRSLWERVRGYSGALPYGDEDWDF